MRRRGYQSTHLPQIIPCFPDCRASSRERRAKRTPPPANADRARRTKRRAGGRGEEPTAKPAAGGAAQAPPRGEASPKTAGEGRAGAQHPLPSAPNAAAPAAEAHRSGNRTADGGQGRDRAQRQGETHGAARGSAEDGGDGGAQTRPREEDARAEAKMDRRERRAGMPHAAAGRAPKTAQRPQPTPARQGHGGGDGARKTAPRADAALLELRRQWRGLRVPNLGTR